MTKRKIAPRIGSPVPKPRSLSPRMSFTGMLATYTRTPAARVSLMRKNPPAVCRAEEPKVLAKSW